MDANDQASTGQRLRALEDTLASISSAAQLYGAIGGAACTTGTRSAGTCAAGTAAGSARADGGVEEAAALRDASEGCGGCGPAACCACAAAAAVARSRSLRPGASPAQAPG